MIIRPVVKREYTSLPNAILTDRRLSADTRAMLAFVLSKPRNWEVRPRPLAKALSGPLPVGLKRLARMFHEASAAGYMVRSEAQEHKQDGSFGRYGYWVGMPEDIADVRKGAQDRGVELVTDLGVANLPQRPEACTPEAYTRGGVTIHKRRNLETKESTNPLTPTLRQASSPAGRAIERSIEGQEIVQDRLAKRVGGGDAERGWSVLLSLPDNHLDQLTASERVGKLTDENIHRTLQNAFAGAA
jgi:hypothetical protein